MFWFEIGLRFLAWVISTTNASDKTKKKFLELVEATKNDGLISVKARDTFDKQFKEIMLEGSDAGHSNSNN